MSPVRRVKQTNTVVAGLESIILILWQQTKPCKRNFVYTIITSIYQQSYFNADLIRPFNSESENCYICQIIANGQKIFKEYLHVDHIVIILRYLMIIFMLPNISMEKFQNIGFRISCMFYQAHTTCLQVIRGEIPSISSIVTLTLICRVYNV